MNKRKPKLQVNSTSFAMRLNTVSFFEFVYSSAGVDEFLLTREVRVALRANIYLDNVNLFGRTGNEGFAASALNFHLMILGMNIRFHAITS